jgi:glucose/arabinose dehydrogenase
MSAARSARLSFLSFFWLFLAAAALLASAAGAATLPTGFAETRIATGIPSPTAMAFAPDGRLFVAQQNGQLRVIKNNALLAQPFLTVSVNSAGERGLLGVAFDPNFASNGFVYVYYTTASAPIHNRLSRFTASAANPDVAAAGSEVQLLNLPNLSSATNHNGGAIHFGTDGRLYVAVGENANGANAPSFNTTLGKMLRMNPDGSVPADNPHLGQTTGQNQLIWARGLRNPFNFAIDRTNGRIHVNDVGENTWEEVNLGVAGSNYGWPAVEGPNPAGQPGVRYPIHNYQNAGSFCAITGAAFYRPVTQTFPAEYAGRYFFGDFCGGFMRMLSPPNYDTAQGFATGIASLVDIQVHTDGSLWYLARGNGGEVFRVQFTGAVAPTISSHPSNATVAAGQTASFTVAASGTAPLSFQWQRNGVNIAGATSPTFTLTATAADNGASFRAVVTNNSGSATSNPALLTVLSNSPPTGTITSPANGATYRGGQVFNFAATGTDPETGTLPPSAFTWRVDFHHDDHNHPHVPPTTGNTGTFTIADRGEVSDNVFYRVHLTVRDPAGLTHSSFRDIQPLKSVIRLESNVAGAQLTLDGLPVTAPFQFTSVEGVFRTIGVVTPQTTGGVTYDFVSWSDGGAATHEINTPTNDTTFTALLQPSTSAVLFSDDFEAARGWTPTAGANTATTGAWARGDPQPTASGVQLQPDTCDGPSVNCFVTALAAGAGAGANDIDGGVTSVQSPAIALPAGGTINLRFRYYLAHLNNATNADFFRVQVVGNNGVPQTVFNRAATAANVGFVWATQTVNLSAFAGQTIRLRFEAADAGTASLVEAGFDNVSVTRQ